MDSRSAESIYAEFLSRRELGEDDDFDALCAKHPEQAEMLREIHSGSPVVEAGLEPGSEIPADAGESVYTSGESADDVAWQRFIEQLKSHQPPKSRYVFKGQVAQGGMGVIHRVYDEDIRRHLAMKVILGRGSAKKTGDTPDVDSRSLGRFLEEAQVTGQLDHPGIVPVHELGVDDQDNVYFTMKLVKGEDLRSVFDRVHDPLDDGWNQTRALSLMLRVCEAMAYAHDKGVIHRDLKPSNIMVGKYGETYVMDWGLARVLGKKDKKDKKDVRIRPVPGQTSTAVQSHRKDSSDATPDSPLITMDGDVVGTPAYMSPEQARGELEEIGPQSDVYALGAMLYHLLAGHMPYVPPGVVANQHAIWQWVQQGPPQSLDQVAKDAPVELTAICEKAMSRSLVDRYADMEELAIDLRAFLEHRVVAAYESGAIAELKKWVKRNRGITVTAAAALLAVLCLSGWALVERQTAIANEQTARGERSRADANAEEARNQAAAATARKSEFDQLAGVVLLENALTAEKDLYPAWPEKIEAMETWLADHAEKLSSLKPAVITTVSSLEGRALPWTYEEQELDRTTHTRYAELKPLTLRDEVLQRPRKELLNQRAADDVSDEEWGEVFHAQREIARGGKSADEVSRELLELNQELSRRRTWRFATASELFLHNMLSDLPRAIETFEEIEKMAVLARLSWARKVEELTAWHPNASSTWEEARKAVAAADGVLASVLYRARPIHLKPQTGLVPIGMNPVTKLWEFYHLRSAWNQASNIDPSEIAIPSHGEDGSIKVEDGTGIVFVLVPGGPFWMGAQKGDPEEPNYDPSPPYRARPKEVLLHPYFIARHELTVGQWFRLSDGKEPSEAKRGVSVDGETAFGWTHPVENVTWMECNLLLTQYGLLLPTEAQWERGARGGTMTPWWTGSEPASLEGAANVMDVRFLSRLTGDFSHLQAAGFDDGYGHLAPVGQYRFNPFGLFDVFGNVSEWCMDGRVSYMASVREGDGLLQIPNHHITNRAIRGGHWVSQPIQTRSAESTDEQSSHRSEYRGLRPARALVDP